METVLMPQLGISEESAILTTWHVKAGDAVKPGGLLFSIETGKSSFDVECETQGTVLALFAAEGDEVAVKAPVCAIGEAGEEPVNSEQRTTNNDTAEPAAVSAFPATPAVNDPLLTVNCIGVSPRAKNLALKLGVDPTQAIPTGPEGRVIERDVRALYEMGGGGDGQRPSLRLIIPSSPCRIYAN
jgi:pyruvate dehydrogenase E2 component (dihydrolipoamide acetyltransferase)